MPMVEHQQLMQAVGQVTAALVLRQGNVKDPNFVALISDVLLACAEHPADGNRRSGRVYAGGRPACSGARSGGDQSIARVLVLLCPGGGATINLICSCLPSRCSCKA